MKTYNERREVARRLRECSGGRKAFHLGRLCAACGIDKSRLMSRTTDADAEAWARLADLIEPSCDRERLLAIATTMAADSVRSAKQGGSVSPVYILHAARDIAEACGETLVSIRNRELAKWGTSIVPKETVVDRDALLAQAKPMEEVVRCRDCVHAYRRSSGIYCSRFLQRGSNDRQTPLPVNTDGFCAWGVRGES